MKCFQLLSGCPYTCKRVCESLCVRVLVCVCVYTCVAMQALTSSNLVHSSEWSTEFHRHTCLSCAQVRNRSLNGCEARPHSSSVWPYGMRKRGMMKMCVLRTPGKCTSGNILTNLQLVISCMRSTSSMPVCVTCVKFISVCLLSETSKANSIHMRCRCSTGRHWKSVWNSFSSLFTLVQNSWQKRSVLKRGQCAVENHRPNATEADMSFWFISVFRHCCLMHLCF